MLTGRLDSPLDNENSFHQIDTPDMTVYVDKKLVGNSVTKLNVTIPHQGSYEVTVEAL